MSATSERTNALDILDRNVPTRFLWSLTLLATLGGFLFGYDTSNIGAALKFIPYQLNDFTSGYLVAGASLGAAAGALLAGPLTDRFGRKVLLVIDALIYAIGAILCALTWHIAVLMIARTLIGLAIGADSAIATAYIAEYAPANRRGALSMLQQWMITVGILFAYLVALVILKVWPEASDVDWRWFFGLGAIPAIIGLIFRFEMPESPRWLIRKGRYDDAQRTFARLDVNVSVADVEYTRGSSTRPIVGPNAPTDAAGHPESGAPSPSSVSSLYSSRSRALTCRCITAHRCSASTSKAASPWSRRRRPASR